MKPRQFTYDWFSPIEPVLARHLGPLAGKPALGLEIGSFEGLSTCWLMEHALTHPSSVLTCVDHFQGGSDHQGLVDLTNLKQRFLDNTEAFAPRIQLIPLDSWHAFKLLETDKFHFVFVDGSHDKWDVLHDAVEGWRVTRPGGLLIFDDYGWGMDRESRPGVAIDAFLNCFSSRVEVVEKGYCVVTRKL